MKRQYLLKRAALVVSFLLSPIFTFAGHAEVNKILYAAGGTSGFDWYAAPAFKKPVSSIATGPVKLQARFVWNGVPNVSWTGQDHAIVMYGQGSNEGTLNSPFQPQSPGQDPQDRTFWTYGVGAFVGETGLNLELWFGPSSAYYWNAGRLCGVGVKTPDPVNICLTSFVNEFNTNYLTPLPVGWKVKFGVPYWLRIEIVSDPQPGYAVLRAQLLEEAPSGSVTQLQSGSIRLIQWAFLPYAGNMRGVIARAPGTGKDIYYSAFDYGF